MYGLVNQGIQGLITENYGSAIWEKIKAKAGYEDVTFLASHLYDDSVTFSLATTASEVLDINLAEGIYTLQSGYFCFNNLGIAVIIPQSPYPKHVRNITNC